jgi:hypothetical protein
MGNYTGDGSSQDGLIGIVTHYGLDGLVYELWWGRDFSHPSRQVQSQPSLLYSWYQDSFLVLEQPVWSIDHPPQSSTRVKEG